jgi:hypothetical protein
LVCLQKHLWLSWLAVGRRVQKSFCRISCAYFMDLFPLESLGCVS